MSAKKPEVILKMGVEGGSITLYGIRQGNEWWYSTLVVDQTPSFLPDEFDQSEIREESGWVRSLVAALYSIDHYQWHRFHALTVHPQFRKRIWSAVQRRFARDPMRFDHALARWREIYSVIDWFERLTGFREEDYDDTRARLAIDGDRLRSLVNEKSYGIGALELVSLETLRERVHSARLKPGKLKVSIVRGDVRVMHRSSEYAGALFQVASQFNLLEMVSPEIAPEAGVTRYDLDRTQGPACAIAAGAATIYRNYFAPVGNRVGQTKDHQLDGLADLGEALGGALKLPVSSLWKMQNGYALCSGGGLDAISQHLGASDARELDRLRGRLRIGLHRDVEVTDTGPPVAEGPDERTKRSPPEQQGELFYLEDRRPRVSQAFCSALPVAYTPIDASRWAPFARLVLEAAYEATMLAAIENASSGVSNVVLLTQLGGGAFGNRDEWVQDATRRALKLVSDASLDVRLVSYGRPSQILLDLARDFE